VVRHANGRRSLGQELPDELRDDEAVQSTVFSAIAGPFMGSDRRRGRTYTWLHQHLSDAFEQTSPRSFLLAVSRAATTRQVSQKTAIDYNGIKDGVVAVYDKMAQRRTAERILETLQTSDRPGPLAFDEPAITREEGLLRSLIALGVVERRDADRINMPDLFRVAARIKRRGGVKPPGRA
jgi:hypothetical protein